MADDRFGCVWAPDIIYDKESDDYLLHWSSPFKGKPHIGIYCSRTKDFKEFSKPELLYEMEEKNRAVLRAEMQKLGLI